MKRLLYILIMSGLIFSSAGSLLAEESATPTKTESTEAKAEKPAAEGGEENK